MDYARTDQDLIYRAVSNYAEQIRSDIHAGDDEVGDETELANLEDLLNSWDEGLED